MAVEAIAHRETPRVCNIRPASLAVRRTFSFMTGPSTQRNALSSKTLIDAARQLPAAGGPNVFAEHDRTVMEERAADAFALVGGRREKYFSGG